jgi:DNA/RNA endonuclease G (NUC1)
VSRGANEQAFYYSNIAPQLQSGFNTGGGVWNNLESYCDGQLCSDTLYMVNGCYWENYNTKSSGTVIPTHYYKVLLRTKKGNTGKWVVNCSESELKCVVFMVEHNSSQHQVKPHRGMMMSVAELEEMTGHTFFPNVKNAPKDTYNPSDWGL